MKYFFLCVCAIGCGGGVVQNDPPPICWYPYGHAFTCEDGHLEPCSCSEPAKCNNYCDTVNKDGECCAR